MSYSTVAQVRKEAGDPHPEDVTDTDIQNAIDSAEVIINNATGQTYVQGTDLSWALANEISKLYASAFVMWKFDDPKDEAQKNFDLAELLLHKLVTEDQGSGDVVVATSDYKTNPLNPDAPISRGRLSNSKISAKSINPDDIYEF